MKKGNYVKIILFLALILLSIFLVVKFNLYTFFTNRDELANYIKSFGPLSVLIFVALQVAQVLVAPIPGEISGFIGGYLYGPVLGTLYSTIGLTIGSMLAFYLARLFGQPFVEKAISPSTLQKYDYFIEHRGAPLIFILFFIPGFPKDTLSYIIGLSRMQAKTFLVICMTGRLMGTVLLSVSGNYAKNGHTGAMMTIFAIGVAITVLGSYYHKKILTLLRRKKTPENKDPREPLPKI
jgi:uncharacterized membrane protein YdjX (TVP38/TMEM64 family)